MIYQLLKRDYLSWLLVAGLCAAVALGDWLGYVETALFAALAILLFLNRGSRGRRCTEFDAALPIRARDLFLARLLSDFALVWLPLLVIIATSPLPSGMTRRDADIFFLEVGAIITFGVALIQSPRILQFAPPRSWQTGVVAASGLAIIFSDELSARSVLLICAVGTCVLLLRIFILAPLSMQAAPENLPAQKDSESNRWLPEIPWLPVLRALFRADFVATFAVLAISGALGWPFLGAAFAMWMFAMELWRLRDRNRWLLSEPVPRSLLFVLIVGGLLLSYMAGTFFQPYIRHQSARTAVIDFLIAGSYFLVPLAILGVCLIRPRARLFWLRLLAALTLLAAPEFFVRFFWSGRARGLHTAPVEQMFNSILPRNFSLLIPAVGFTLTVLGWAAYQASFRQMDFPQLRSKQGVAGN